MMDITVMEPHMIVIIVMIAMRIRIQMIAQLMLIGEILNVK
jgi:hypothetical protein